MYYNVMKYDIYIYIKSLTFIKCKYLSLTNHCFKSDCTHYVVIESNPAIFIAITMNQNVKNVIIQAVSCTI